MSAPERFETVIIGAGMSGLAAGLRLAQFDQRVLILEKHYLWGGLNSYYKKGGRRFDVGLHALTNFVPRGTRGRPLTRILRQLRIGWDELRLGQQLGSKIAFPGVELRFDNDFELLRQEVAERFPSQVDGFARLTAACAEYADGVQDGPWQGARARLAEYLSDRLLIDMLLLPVCYYGSPTADDVEWTSFVTLFKSLYEEGFARPEGGIRGLLDMLRRRYLDHGGELRLRAGVERIEHGRDGVTGLVLEDGTRIAAECVLSSAGWIETMRLCGGRIAAAHGAASDAGELTFVEMISVLDTRPAQLGHETTITFFNRDERLYYRRPDAAVDYTSGVICCPDNYVSAKPLPEGLLRLTLPADHGRWCALDEDDYVALKEEAWQRGHEAILDFAPDIRPHTVFKDVFTPRTIEHFTGRVNGALYGTPAKRRSGVTPVPGLFLCGTDQGMLGIVGAMLSGIAMANQHALVPVSRR